MRVWAGSKPVHAHGVGSLRVKNTLQVVVFVFVLCSVTETKLLLTASLSFTNIIIPFLSKTGNSRLLLPFDPPLLSMALLPAQGWAPSASGADTGHLSSPVTELHETHHLITPPHYGNTYVTCVAILQLHPQIYNNGQKHCIDPPQQLMKDL